MSAPIGTSDQDLTNATNALTQKVRDSQLQMIQNNFTQIDATVRQTKQGLELDKMNAFMDNAKKVKF
jgi:hypothetical protein